MAKILIVDDREDNIEILKELLKDENYTIESASNGVEGLEKIEKDAPDLILMDAQMPKMDGFEMCKIVKENYRTRFIPVIMITVLSSTEDRIKAIEAGVDDFVPKPFNRLEVLARTKSLINVKHLTDELDNAHNILFALAKTIEAKDQYTEGHTERVTGYARELAKKMKLSDDQIEALRIGSLLHDMGKINVPDKILNKPGKLNDQEFEKIKEHPDWGAKICKNLKSVKDALPVIKWHHEKIDGSGYPDGLKGDDIPITAKIMAVVDVYDALSTQRPYKKAFSPEKCFQILREEVAKGWWDREIVENFIELMQSKT